MKLTWKGTWEIPAPSPEYGAAFSSESWPTVREVQVVDSRAYVRTEAAGRSFYWFVMDLKGLETPGAPHGAEWVQVTLGGNVPARMRNTEHFPKKAGVMTPGYLEEKFPGYTEKVYDAMAYFFVPFLTTIFERELVTSKGRR